MNRKPQAVPGHFEDVCRAAQAVAEDEAGVSAIEYALLASLIVVVAAGSIAALGGGTDGLWTRISDLVTAAI